MKGTPTERQAAQAARQLHYHRERLGWIEVRMRDNEALLLSYLTRTGAGAAVLPGGYRVSGGAVSPDGDVAVEKLAPGSPCEQLVLRTGVSETARSDAFRSPPDG
jgi:hypothetical protein